MVLGLHTCCLSKRPWICPPGRSLEAKEPVGSLCYLSKSPPGSPKNSSHSLLHLRLQSRWPLTPKGPSTQLTDLNPFLSFKPITEQTLFQASLPEKEATDHPPLPCSPPTPPQSSENTAPSLLCSFCVPQSKIHLWVPILPLRPGRPMMGDGTGSHCRGDVYFSGHVGSQVKGYSSLQKKENGSGSLAHFLLEKVRLATVCQALGSKGGHRANPCHLKTT